MKKQRQSTKERILSEALALFSVKGYEPVTVVEIADAVGIKAPSLYKHYKSKQDIFNAIIQEMEKRYGDYASTLQMSGFEPDKDAVFFMNVTEEQLIDIAMAMFSYFLHDEYTYKFRKMLNIEQYNHPHLAKIYTKQYFDDPLSFQGTMFHLLIQLGFMIPENPQIMTLHFYAPIFLCLKLCDSQPEREGEAIEMIKKHIIQFNKLYKISEV